MGSNGGGGRRYPSTENIRDLLNRSNRDGDEAAYEAEVNEILSETLRNYNDRDVATIRQHLEAVKDALEADGNGAIDLLFGGSVQKHTYIDGLSDVDVLAIVNRRSFTNESPQQIIESFAQDLQRRFPNNEVSAGRLAITIRYADGTELQILPALSTPSGIRIARASGDGWSNVIRPDAFARKLTTVNQERGGRVIPVTKLFKGLAESIRSSDARISGYHAESIAVQAFEDYSGSLSHKSMLQHLVQRAADIVKTSIQDDTGQSLHVDDHLGHANSQPRLQLSARLQRLAQRLEAADRTRDTSRWQELLESD